MNRTLTVSGEGRVRLKPDTVCISLTLKSVDINYSGAMEHEEELLDSLHGALLNAGFEKDGLKTERFNVYTEYESVRDENGNYKSVFKGYACVHELALEFGFDTKLLSMALNAIACCVAEPEISICFTLKDKDKACEEMLRNAAEDAVCRARILADASGVKLGRLISADYSRKNMNAVSPTAFAMDAKCMAINRGSAPDIVPGDIELEDNVTFVWEIED